MPYLDEESFERTLLTRMRELGPHDVLPFDFWPYVETIPVDDFRGFDFSAGTLRSVWRGEDGVYEHVLIEAKGRRNVLLAIVLDRAKKEVVGHRLLDVMADSNEA